jgi:tetratricopeptide (TPR) repeat protein
MAVKSVPGDPSVHRRFLTIKDVENALDTEGSKLSFTECLDCIEITTELKDRPLREKAIERAIQLFNPKNMFQNKFSKFVTAATGHFLSKGKDLESLSGGIGSAKEFISNLKNEYFDLKPSDRQLHEEDISDWAYTSLRTTTKKLVELSLLLAETTPEARIRLSSTLRKNFECPELAIDAASRALQVDSNDLAALTTRGAAFVDLHNFQMAKEDLRKAWKIDRQSTHVLVAISRCLFEEGNKQKSLEFAKQAVEICEGLNLDDPSVQRSYKISLWSMLRAAAENEQQKLLGKISEIGDISNPDDFYFFLLSVRQVLENGEINRAESLLKSGLDLRPNLKSSHESQIKKLRAQIKRAKDRNQGQLDV